MAPEYFTSNVRVKLLCDGTILAVKRWHAKSNKISGLFEQESLHLCRDGEKIRVAAATADFFEV